MELECLGSSLELLILLCFTAAVRPVGGATNQQPTLDVHRAGDFLRAHGRALAPNVTSEANEALRICECRNRCWVQPSCTAFSVRPNLSDRLECSFTENNTYVNAPVKEENSTYYVRFDPRDVLGIDNLIYRRLSDKAQGYQGAKASCEKLPGFRLTAVKNKSQMRTMLQLCLGRTPTTETSCSDNKGWFYVDMIKINDVSMIQGKIPANETDLGDSLAVNEPHTTFIYAHSLKLHDYPDGDSFLPVCQANLFGIPW